MGDEDKSCGAEYLYRLLLLLAFTAPNCLSSALVGRGLVGLGLFVMSPYLALVVAALPRARPANFRLRPTKFKPAAMVSVAYWSLSGFDSVSTFAGEVEAPHRTLPRALLCGCLLMVVCYVLPLTAGVLADEEWAHFLDTSSTLPRHFLQASSPTRSGRTGRTARSRTWRSWSAGAGSAGGC